MKAWQAVTSIVAISAGLTLLSVPSLTWLTPATLNLTCGVSALALMAAAAILASRWSLIEGGFGGLDRVYEAHKWMGVIALSLASFHLLFKADDSLWQTEAILALPAAVTRFVRQASFVALMTIVILALNRNIPYSIWRWWHRLSGPLFLGHCPLAQHQISRGTRKSHRALARCFVHACRDCRDLQALALSPHRTTGPLSGGGCIARTGCS
jgi:predicted ferric reductase